MNLEIKLKAGFFKTSRYSLSIDNKQILLLPQDVSEDDSENGKLVIDDNDLTSVCISIGNLGTGEIEIVAQSGIYIGNFVFQMNLEEVGKVFANEFGHKFILHYGVF